MTSIDDDEEARAFLQARVALFWKVICVIMLFATGLAVVGAVKNPGADLVIDAALALLAGIFWWSCARGKRSIRFSRTVELVGLLLFFTGSSFLGRYVLVGFARERSLLTAEGALMADAYLSVLGLVGAALQLLVRAALIPSSPRRTILYTAMVGVPTVVTVKLPGDPTVNVVVAALVNVGAPLTVSVKDWTAGGLTPLSAVKVIV